MCDRFARFVLGASAGLAMNVALAEERHVPSQSYPTIQSAIDASADGDSIVVASGTYVENLVIDKAVLIRSASGRTQTSIRLGAGVGIDIAASGVTIGGAASSGFTIQPDPNSSPPTYAIQIADHSDTSNIVVSHNVIDTRGNCLHAISIGAGTTQALTFSGNNFLLDAGDDGIVWRSSGAATSNVTIAENTFDSSGTTNAVRLERAGASVISIRDNAVYGNSGTIRLNLGTLSMSGIAIEGNTFQGAGIVCAEPGTGASGPRLAQLTIAGNLFDAGNGAPALQVLNSVERDDVAWSSVAVRGNQILRSVGSAYGAVDVGVLDMGTDRLSAERNYWGDPVGPTNPGNPLVGGAMAGAEVVGAVNFTPWYATISTTPGTERYKVTHAGTVIAYADTFGGALRAVGSDPTDSVRLTSNDSLVYPLPPGAQGPQGSQGPQGPRGSACWDLNNNGQGDVATEDRNGDGVVDVNDCRGADGAPGVNGVACWDLNGNGSGDPAEDTNGDGHYNVLDCRGPRGDLVAGGPAGGVACWDLNGNGLGDPDEDTNGDGSYDSLDCQGSAGTSGASGASGANGLSCWDLNGNGVADLDEDINGDGHFDALDCRGPRGEKGEPGEVGPAGTAVATGGCGLGLSSAWMALSLCGLAGLKAGGWRAGRGAPRTGAMRS